MGEGTTPRDRSALRELHAHAVDPKVAVAAGCKATARGIAMPWPDVGGTERLITRVHPELRTDRKLEGWPKGVTPGLKLVPRPERHSRNRATLDAKAVIVVEGFMQCLAVASHAPAAYEVFGINGCWGLNEAVAETMRPAIDGADVWLLFDADRRTKEHVAKAVERTVANLRQAGASGVRLVNVPGVGIDGIDDVLARRDEAERSTFLADLLDAATDSAAESSRHLVVTRASEIKPKATRWLWSEREGESIWADFAKAENWLPLGCLALLGGRESTGKSTWAYRLAAQITTGELPGYFEGTPRSVVIAATEDDWAHTIAPRLIAAGADLDRVLRVEVVTGEVTAGVTLPTDVAALREVCIEHEVALVLLDPLMGAIDGELDSHKDHEVRVALEPVSRLAHDARVTVLGLIHVNKSVGTDLLNRIMGSRAFVAVARAVLMTISEDPLIAEPGAPDRCLIGQAKNSLGARVGKSLSFEFEAVHIGKDDETGEPLWSSRIKLVGDKPGHIDDLSTEQENRKPPRETVADRCEKWLEEALRGKGKVPSSWLRRAAKDKGFKKTTLYKARDELGVHSVSKDGSTETFWVLDEEEIQGDGSADEPNSAEEPDKADEADEDSFRSSGSSGPSAESPRARPREDTPTDYTEEWI